MGSTKLKLAALAVADRDWQDHANCLGLDADLFFPARGDSTAVKAAKAVCVGCTVRWQCLDYALAHSIKFGMWGGTSERERRRMRHQRAARQDGAA